MPYARIVMDFITRHPILVLFGLLAAIIVVVVVAILTGGEKILAENRAQEILKTSSEEDIYDELDDQDEGESELEKRVRQAFDNDPILHDLAIDIHATEGDIIDLTGRVRTDEESDHAGAIARDVPGVEVVFNMLEIQPVVGYVNTPSDLVQPDPPAEGAEAESDLLDRDNPSVSSPRIKI